MKTKYFLILCLCISAGIYYFSYSAEALEITIPPTPAFSNIKVNGTWYNATTYNESLIINTAGGGSGENNTASNVGVGYGLFKQKTGIDLEFLNIFCAGDLLCSSNSTDVRLSYITPPGGSNALDDLTDVTITGPSPLSVLYYVGSQWIDKIFSVNTVTCGAGQFVNIINNQTGATSCGTPSGSGNMTVLNDGGDVTITSPSPLSVLYYVGSQWIDKIFSVKTQTASNDVFITGINNQTGVITTNQFSVNTITCGSTDKISAINNVTGAVTCSTDSTGSGGGVTTLSGNVTSVLSGNLHTLVWTIPLTANSGNALSFNIVANSATVGVAPQIGLNTTVSGSKGWCTWETPITATTSELDVVSANSTARYVRDTGATTWLPTTASDPMPIIGDCAIKTGATPGNALVYVQSETGGSVQVKAGSFYIKTP